MTGCDLDTAESKLIALAIMFDILPPDAMKKMIEEDAAQEWSVDLDVILKAFLRLRAQGPTEGWRDISTALMNGQEIIGRAGNAVRTTWTVEHYEKWPHQEGGPTFRKLWTYEALDGLMGCGVGGLPTGCRLMNFPTRPNDRVAVYPFKGMEVGDAFCVGMLYGPVANARSAAWHWAKRHGVKFSLYLGEDGEYYITRTK